MTSEQIDVFLSSHTNNKAIKLINIAFRTRQPIKGFFLTGADFEDLKSKNFWRIITEGNLESWNQTKNISLSRIFNGSDMTKLKVEVSQ